MDNLDTLLKKLQQQAIEAAKRLDPEFAAKVDADQREIEEHERRLTDQRDAAKQKEEPAEATHRKEIWGRMIESQK